MKLEFIFGSANQEEEAFHQQDLVRLLPFGVTIATEVHRPFLILKDEKHEVSLPVAMNNLEVGVTLTQANKMVAPVTPHRFTEMLLGSLDIQLCQCVFVEIKGSHQYVRLYMKGHPQTNSLKLKAEDAMSLCLHLDVPIYATRKIISQSQVLMAELEGLAKGVLAQSQILNQSRQHYIM